MEQLAISKQYPFNSLSVQKAKHNLYESTAQLQGTYPAILCPTALVGIEIEIEKMYNGAAPTHYWNQKPDGSLRDCGMEFASIPLRGYQVPYALEHLFKEIKERGNKYHFSPRTSVHVHLNVRDMTWDQIKSLTLLYAIFEKHFFAIAGTKREESIFCVPLYKTAELQYLRDLPNYCYTWHKYSAINLGTILGNDDVSRMGTIEFRHLYGTDDINIIINWINNIMCLRQACIKYSYDELFERIMHMNTTSEYIQMYEQVFKEYANTRVMVHKDFDSCITQAKLNLLFQKYRTYASNNSVLSKKQSEHFKQQLQKPKVTDFAVGIEKLKTYWVTKQTAVTINDILAEEGF